MNLHLLCNDNIRVWVVKLIQKKLFLYFSINSVTVLNEGESFDQLLSSTLQLLYVILKLLILFLVKVT